LGVIPRRYRYAFVALFSIARRIATPRRLPYSLQRESVYRVSPDLIVLRTNDARLSALADRLWFRASRAQRVPAATPIILTIRVESRSRRWPEQLKERWRVEPDRAELTVGSWLRARIDFRRARLAARIASSLPELEPGLIARLLLETPSAALLARRAYAVVHAAAIVGPAGAVVIRGAPGAGKSTLAAAAFQAGLDILGDETVLVSRSDPDELLAAVRDLALLPSSTRLLGLQGAVTSTTPSKERKDRFDLLSSSHPGTRRVQRVATVLLGSRSPGPARLERLEPEVFVREFQRGAIPQERWSGTPDYIAERWSRGQAYGLNGSEDLAGAVELLRGLVSAPAVANRA
jgi:hypothetical protein